MLVGLANHAGPDGAGAFPSVATLVRYTGLSERTVRTCLDRLQAAGVILPCDPDIVAARIKRADRRPQGWDLNLSLVIWNNRTHYREGRPLDGTVREDITALPPTPGNIAKANVHVPPGFRKVPSSTFGGPVSPYFTSG